MTQAIALYSLTRSSHYILLLAFPRNWIITDKGAISKSGSLASGRECSKCIWECHNSSMIIVFIHITNIFQWLLYCALECEWLHSNDLQMEDLEIELPHWMQRCQDNWSGSSSINKPCSTQDMKVTLPNLALGSIGVSRCLEIISLDSFKTSIGTFWDFTTPILISKKYLSLLRSFV